MNRETSRREFLAGAAAGLGLGAVIAVTPAHATPQEMQDAIRKVVGSVSMSPPEKCGETIPM